MLSAPDNADLKYWLCFHRVPGFGPKRFKLLTNRFPTLAEAWQAGPEELRLAGLEPTLIANLAQAKSRLNPQKELERLLQSETKAVTVLDPLYPKLLKEIPDAPPVIYYHGELPNTQFTIAVVGTRKISEYGRQATELIVSFLAQNGLTIVSGLALGVDGLAHQVTVENQGTTIAVLGSGLDLIFPQANAQLAQRIIASGGALISEFPLGTPALKQHFPVRNRIIAGLSLGTLVVEAAAKSGALITAYLALDYNREVFAVPGSIFHAQSEGANKLIKLGAKVVATGQDILDALDLKTVSHYQQAQKFLPATKEEEKIYRLLDKEAKNINYLIKLTGLSTASLTANLTLMEMKGLIRDLGGQRYVKK